ncbi:TIGR04222 domain-containing membrane protein [Streptomyces sp. NPDC093600]|uniref:TIGR04222 domain-containing membrane protein n=1 Tax=Streptomyces sp. NPDC093600 TaxID=3366047 RepID=UPI0037F74E87
MYDNGLTALAPLLASGASLRGLWRERAECEASVEPAGAPDPADPLPVALLAGGPKRVADTVLFGMHQAGRLVLDGKKARAGTTEAYGSGPWERLVAERVARGAVDTHRLHEKLAESNPLTALDEALVRDGLLHPLGPLRAWRRSWYLHAVVCVVSAFVGVAASDGEGGAAWLNPVSLCVLALLLVGLPWAPFGRFTPEGRLTPAGAAALRRLREAHRRLDGSSWANAPACGHEHPHADPEGIGVALFGTNGIRDKALRRAIRKANERPSSSGCGGGGGCGGCGG